MIERKESEGTGVSGRRLDPRLDDPPKPVVYAGEGSPLTAKIAKLTERLAVAEQAEPKPAPPALLMSGSLNEARAYLQHIEPSAGEEPITLEMRRVRIADEVNAATWVTERVDCSLSSSSSAAAPEVARAPVVGLQAADAAGDVLSEEAGSRPRESHKARAVALVGLACALAVGIVVLVAGGKRSQARETLAQPALVPFGLVELTASLAGELESQNERTAQATGALEGAQTAEAALSEAPGVSAVRSAATPKLTGSLRAPGSVRSTPQSKGLRPTRNVPSKANKTPELVTNDPTTVPFE